MIRKTQKQLKKRLWLHCGILKVLETKGKKWGWHYPSFHSCLFPPIFFSRYSKKKTKLGSLLWSRLQDSLGFHLHTHITIIISSALYLLKSAIKTEWLQKNPRFFKHTKKHFYFLKVALISGSFSPSPFPQKYVPNHYISSTFKKVRNFLRLGHIYRTKVYRGFSLKVEK